MNFAQISDHQSTTSAQAPLQVEFRFRLNLPPSDAFDLVSVRLGEWFSSIHDVTWNHTNSVRGPKAVGACSERICSFSGKALVEKIVEYEPGRRYAYSADLTRSEMKMPLRDHLGTFDVVPVGTGSVITWRQHFRPLWYVPRALLCWQMRDKLMRPAVGGLIQTHGGALLSVR